MFRSSIYTFHRGKISKTSIFIKEDTFSGAKPDATVNTYCAASCNLMSAKVAGIKDAMLGRAIRTMKRYANQIIKNTHGKDG